MLSWIPLIGPIIDGIVSIVKGQQDTTVEKYQEDTKRIGTETTADVSVIQARAQVAIAMKDDIGTRLCKDLVMFFGSLHTGFLFWDHIFAAHPSFVFGVTEMGPTLQYIPYAIIAYLFVTAYRGR